MNEYHKSWPEKYIIGLTGNIAAGKSSISALLSGTPQVKVLDADLIAHEVLQPDGICYGQVLDHFGPEILQNTGRSHPPIDRGRLGSLVFKDGNLLRQLEAITHPAIRRILIEQISSSSEPIIVLEAIKLLESSLRAELDAIWVVNASESIRKERLLKLRGMSPEVAQQRIAAQAPQRDKLAQADLIIENDGCWEDTVKQVEAALVPILEQKTTLAEEPARRQLR